MDQPARPFHVVAGVEAGHRWRADDHRVTEEISPLDTAACARVAALRDSRGRRALHLCARAGRRMGEGVVWLDAQQLRQARPLRPRVCARDPRARIAHANLAAQASNP